MARAIYPHELTDQDFSWLITNFIENHPEYIQVDAGYLPAVLIQRGVVEEESFLLTEQLGPRERGEKSE